MSSMARLLDRRDRLPPAMQALWLVYLVGVATFVAIDLRTGLVDVTVFDPGLLASFVVLAAVTYGFVRGELSHSR